ncbi:MAG: NAD(P)H-quinone oxidoreductase [Vulcanimicrobiaceae bacterium]
MRAAIYTGTGGTEVIAVRDDVPEPKLGSDDALVEVAYAGLNRADILERRGSYPAPKRDLVIPGLEFAGTVRAVGSGVSNVAVGDAVCGLVGAGAHASRLTTHALTLSKIPAGLSLRDAAAAPEAFITAHDALFTIGALRLGQSVLVHAVGSGVGLAAVALAKRTGATAIGTSRTAAKLERARAAGLAHGFLLDDGWLGHVLAATDARGADVILDFAGAPMLERNCKALANGGRIVQIGTMAGAQTTFNLGALMFKRGSLHGTVLRSRPLDEKIALAKTFARELLPLFTRGDLRPEIDSIFPLAALAEAHAHMERNANFGKILIEIGADEAA